jgi:hypothetical protein
MAVEVKHQDVLVEQLIERYNARFPDRAVTDVNDLRTNYQHLQLALNAWLGKHGEGFQSGFWNGEEANYGHGVVLGFIMFKY